VVSKGEPQGSKSWALVKVTAPGGKTVLAAGEGSPVNAVDEGPPRHSSKATTRRSRGGTRLIDYRVTLPGAVRHTASTVRVEVTLTDGSSAWTTGSVSDNIVEASLDALTQSTKYYLAPQHAAPAGQNTGLQRLHPGSQVGRPRPVRCTSNHHVNAGSRVLCHVFQPYPPAHSNPYARVPTLQLPH